MKYQPADMVTCNYGLTPEAWDRLQKTYSEHLAKNPVCEICHKNNSVRITPLGKIMASCMECIQIQRQELIDEFNRRMKEINEEEEAYRQKMEQEYDY